MVTTEQYQQKLEESADRVKAVFDAISTCTKALDDIPHTVFKDQFGVSLGNVMKRLAQTAST